MKKLLQRTGILFMLLFTVVGVYAQQNERDVDELISRTKFTANTDSCSILAEKIISTSKKIHYKKGVAAGLLIQLNNLVNEENYEKALQLAYREHQVIFESNDHDKISHLILLRANCYTQLGFLDKSLECLNKSWIEAQKIKDESTRQGALARVFSGFAARLEKNVKDSKRLDSIYTYRKKSLNLYENLAKKSIVKMGYIRSLISLGDIFVDFGKLDSAKYYYNESLTKGEKLKITRFSAQSYNGLAKVAFLSGSIEQALEFSKNALDHSSKMKSKRFNSEIYNLLSKIYLKKRDTIRSLQYMESYAKLTDSILISDKKAMKISSDIILQEKVNSYAKTQKNYKMLIFSGIGIMFLISFLVYKAYLKEKKRKQLLIRKMEEAEKVASPKPEIVKDKNDEQVTQEIIRLAMANDPSFLLKFVEHHPLFIERLKSRSASLSSSDLQICAYLSLGFYTKEISRYTRTSIRAVESKKYRLRKKLEIPASEDINLWMLNA